MFSRSFTLLATRTTPRAFTATASRATKSQTSALTFQKSTTAPFSTSSKATMPDEQENTTKASGENPGEEPGELKTGDYKHRAPYRIHTKAEHFHTEWEGSCHCGKVTYQLSRKEPLAAKYCHCTTCQVLHAAPLQWVAIFKKDDINFTNGHESLTWYDSPEKKLTHQLPCKVSCSYCRSPIMDEGRNMILLYPGLIKGIEKNDNRRFFEAQSHMFYPQRIIDVKDGKTKFAGLDNQSDILDDEGNLIKKWEDVKKEREQEEGKDSDQNSNGKRPHPQDPKEMGKM